MKILPLLLVLAIALATISHADDTTPAAPTTKAKKKKKAAAAQTTETAAPAKAEKHSSSAWPDIDLPDMSGRLGGGGMVGTPMSINAKYWFNSKMAVELGLGFGFIGLGGFEPFGAFLYNLGPVFGTQNAVIKRFSMYVGGGAFAMFGTYGGVLGVGGVSATEFGFYVPVGATWMPTQVPNVEVFVQVGPGIGFGSVSTSAVTVGGTTIAGSSSTGIGGFVYVGGAGARYYFN